MMYLSAEHKQLERHSHSAEVRRHWRHWQRGFGKAPDVLSALAASEAVAQFPT